MRTNNIVNNSVGLESELHVLLKGETMDPLLKMKSTCMLLAAMRDIYGRPSTEGRARCPHANLICCNDEYLANGARVYNDHFYAEYATPLSQNTSEAVAAILAGDQIAKRAARKVQEAIHLHPEVLVVRNNTDNNGHSYASHINIRMTRKGYESIFNNEKILYRFVVPIFVTLPLICGSGRCGSNKGEDIFQIWQRSDFIKTLVNVQTTHDRGLINTRDEALSAKPELFARFHIIAFDANRLEIAEYLKLGLLRLLCAAIDSGIIEFVPELLDPLAAVESISRDAFKPLIRSNNKTITPLEMQRIFQDAFAKLYHQNVFKNRVPDAGEILDQWDHVLTKLEHEPLDLVGSLDWITKYVYLQQIKNYRNMKWSDPQMKWFDITYHALSGVKIPEVPCVPITNSVQIKRLINNAPDNSRDALRAKLLKRFGHEISNVNWHWLVNRNGDKAYLLPDEPQASVFQEIDNANNLEKAADLLGLESLALEQIWDREEDDNVKNKEIENVTFSKQS